MKKRFYVVASDGSQHSYPEGFDVNRAPDSDWVYVSDEDGNWVGFFFRPSYVAFRDEL